MERIIRSNAVKTPRIGRSLEMKLDDFYFYSYLASQMASTYSFFAASTLLTRNQYSWVLLTTTFHFFTLSFQV